MIIDFHTHVAPPEVRDRRTIVSYPYHELREFDTARQLAAISSHNRYASAEIPDRCRW